MFFVIESDIEDIARPGDIVMYKQLSFMVNECGFVMVTAFPNIEDALDYASYYNWDLAEFRKK